jgi:hydrogenase maturation factor HypF (carbamoyltransferase family)
MQQLGGEGGELLVEWCQGCDSGDRRLHLSSVKCPKCPRTVWYHRAREDCRAKASSYLDAHIASCSGGESSPP